MKPDAASLLPLSPDVFDILLSLAEEDRHGYGILKAAEERSGRRGQLQPGALYRLLRQLVELGLVERLGPEEAPKGSDSRRRYYRLSVLGREVAAAETRRMEELVARSRNLLEERDS